MFVDNVKKVMVGQNMTTVPPKYALVKRLLQGDALTQFTLDVVNLGNETNASFEEALKKLITYVFPKRALAIQKRFMRRDVKKPKNIKTRSFINRLVEGGELS